MSPESQDMAKSDDHTLGHALGVVAGTALEQAHVLAIAQIDCWAELLRQRLAATTDESSAQHQADESSAEVPAASPTPFKLPELTKPLLIGAAAGAAVAWFFARRRSET